MDPTVFKDSALYHAWAGGVWFELSRCRRSDLQHFNTCLAIRGMPLADGLALAQRRYPPRRGEDALWNVVLSHRERKKINKRIQRKAAAAQTGGCCSVVRRTLNGEVPTDFSSGICGHVLCAKKLEIEELPTWTT